MRRLYQRNKTKLIIIGTIVVIIIVWILITLFYNKYTQIQFYRALETNIISGLIVGLLVGFFLYTLESDRAKKEIINQQILELKKRALDCFEEINGLIIKIKFYNTLKGDDATINETIKDIRISFDQVANFFYELREIYKKLADVVPDDKKDEVDRLDKFYQSWEKYFAFVRPEDLKKLKKSVRTSENYLVCLKKALIEFIDILRFE